MEIPEIYHSRVRLGSRSAMSLSARNKSINAITDRNPKIPVIDAEILNFFIIVKVFVIKNSLANIFFSRYG